MDNRLAQRKAAVVAGIVFVAILLGGIGFYLSKGLALGVVEILSIVHAALGLGFFAGFIIFLLSWISGKKRGGWVQ